MGAFNGALIAQGHTDQLVDIWDNISIDKVFALSKKEVEELRKIDYSPEVVQNKVKKIFNMLKDGGLDISRSKKMLDDYIDEDLIRSRGIDFGLVTVAINELRAIEIFIDEMPQGTLKDYLLASSALPYFKIEKVNGIKYLDGGFYNILPTDMLVNKGYTEIYQVPLHGIGRKKPFDIDESNVTLKTISPSEPLGGILDFSNDLVKKQMAMGYYDTLKVIDGLSGTLYCIKPVNDEHYFLDFLKTLSQEMITELTEALEIERDPTLRTLFEIIIPRIAELLELEQEVTYEEIITSFLEVQAIELEIDRYHVYSFEELLEQVITKSHTYTEKKYRKNQVVEYFLKNEVLSRMAKESSIRQLAKIVIKGAAKRYEKGNQLGGTTQ